MPVLTFDSLPWILTFVVPGFVAMKVYSLLNPVKRLDWSAAAVEVVSYGSIHLAIWWPVIAEPVRDGANLFDSPWFAAAGAGILIFSPALLAVLASWLRRTEMVRRWLTHPLPSAWDYCFEKQRSCWILFTLKNGTRFGGYFGRNSFASSYPEPPDIFVEDLWRVASKADFAIVSKAISACS